VSRSADPETATRSDAGAGTATGGPPLIEARGLTRILPGLIPVTLVRDIDLVIEAGEFVAITGPSGSGKSSLLYLLGLLDTPTSGEVLINGQPTHRIPRQGVRARACRRSASCSSSISCCRSFPSSRT
jgi:predicted ABC-type transport system involved in lysophospholipase L1 biosynthesis ATPase subunit